METTTSRFKWLNFFAIILVIPTVYFITISVLKYRLGVSGPFDSITPLLERWGIKESLGWNINLLILFGPIIAVIISARQILYIDWHAAIDRIDIRVTVFKKVLPLAILLLSGLTLISLFAYLVGENF